MMKMFKDKKGVLLGPTLTLAVATVIIIVLLIIFFIFVQFMKPVSPGELPKVTLKSQILPSLEAYLNTPVKVQNQEIKMSDLIRLSKIDSSYKNVLESKTKGIFDKVYGNKYRLEIKNLVYIPYAEFLPTYDSAESITIPEKIDITLYLKK